MSAKIYKFYPKNAAEIADAVIEQAIGNYETVFIIGVNKLGEVEARASTKWSVGDILFAVEEFKHKLLSGDYSDDYDEDGV